LVKEQKGIRWQKRKKNV